MSTLKVSRSITIAAAPEPIYAAVRDFHQWTSWSPWLPGDAATKVTIAADGRTYRWESEIIGCGEITITGEQAPQQIDYQLVFLKPHPSKAKTGFNLIEKEATTELTWWMEFSLPWFMGWMAGMIRSFITSDFNRGLLMIKDLIELGQIPAQVEVLGATPFPGLRYVGVSRSTTLDQIGPSMEAAFAQVLAGMATAGIAPSGPGLSIYHKFDLTKGFTHYTAGYPVASVPETLPDGLVAGEIPAIPTYAIRHHGAYRHLPNSWMAGMAHQRAKRFRPASKPAPFEVYEHLDNHEAAHRTMVYLPAR